ncbi:amino acid ABC transporter substrate-binding protein [Bradyrhizobium sp. Cp5.3]|uniref:amino acid ABC transporter substrate-binding protein n=1 Tax=Bradyrhizobium sp. Cp5.3 TaxID=443598 RepID=UPI0003F7BE5E|nr:amino acid ABC transporter substrate-binding protein [Bradyrhizobium sp. Cp5.3]
MFDHRRAIKRTFVRYVYALCVFAGALLWGPLAKATEPLLVGFGMPLTGYLALNGKATLLAIQMWADDVNANGGVMSRPVKLIYYDDQSNPATLPGIYTKLVDLDKVDVIVSSYGTPQIIPVIPFAKQRGLVLMGLCGFAPNEVFKYDRYFAACPSGVNPEVEIGRGFFEIAASQTPKPQTIAIVSVDTEMAKSTANGARELAARYGFRIVYDKGYPANIVDLTPVIRAIQAAKPDLVFVASYPVDSSNFVRSVKELEFQPKMIGGAMVGLQYAAVKAQLGPLLNGFVNYEFYVPETTTASLGIKNFIERYQVKAAQAGTDLLGFYAPPFAYAAMQILKEAIEKTTTSDIAKLDQGKIADYIRSNQFDTIAGAIRFGTNGEWQTARNLLVQFQNVKNSDLEQFRKPGTQVILYPPAYKSGQMIYPFGQ